MDEQQANSKPSSVALPPGAPEWVSETLIRTTLETWQPLTDKVLTPEDALAMLINIGQLYDAVGLTSPEEDNHEEVHRPRTGQ